MTGRTSLGQISESEFTTLLQALSSTAKGRRFLDEYRRRFQPEETVNLLDSLHRIETSMGSVRDQLQPQRIAEELRHIVMSLDIATEGAFIDPEGSETARRFALIDRARHELQTLASNLGSEDEELTVIPPETQAAEAGAEGAPAETAGYRLRDPASDR